MLSALSKNRRWQIIFPVGLALLLTIPFVFLFSDLFPRYRAKLVESGFIDKLGGFEFQEDLDRDGFSEQIVLFNNTQNEASIKIIRQDGSIDDHYYFRGQILTFSTSCFFHDYNHSGTLRIILFTISHDSLLLHCVDPVRKRSVEFQNRFIVKVVQKNGNYDVSIPMPCFSDTDGDGTEELIATILAGFPLKPRVGMRMDFGRDTLVVSPDLGMYFYILSIRDIDGDGLQELFPVDNSIWNYPDSLGGEPPDHKARIAIFDRQFRFRFPPVEFPGRYIRIYTSPVGPLSGPVRLISLISRRSTGSEPVRLLLSDISGNPLKELVLPNMTALGESSILIPDEVTDRVFILNSRGVLEEVDSELNILRSVRLDKSAAAYAGRFDIDEDGRLEHLFSTGSRRVPTMFRSDFSHPVRLDHAFTAEPWFFGVQKRGPDPSRIFIQQGNNRYLFTYGRNPVFFLKYPFYAGVFLSFLAIILLSQYIQQILIQQRIDAQRKIAALQLLVLNNQIDPHFTFNAISSISASILNQRPEEANRSLHSLAWLMRSCMSQSDKLSRSLGEELSFVRHYLDLMRTRMNDGFEFTMDVSPEVNTNWQVPKMVVQIYAENAVKHGLKPKGDGGKLSIAVHCSPFVVRQTGSPPHHSHVAPASPVNTGSQLRLLATCFTICIEDNGIGRKQARLSGEPGTGHGLQMMEQFYATFNRYSKEKIRCDITDLEDGPGNPLGTRVEITIPVGMKYAV